MLVLVWCRCVFQMRAKNKLKCAESTSLLWLAHMLLSPPPPSSPPSPFDAFQLFCCFVLFRFVFSLEFYFLFVSICVVWHRIVSNGGYAGALPLCVRQCHYRYKCEAPKGFPVLSLECLLVVAVASACCCVKLWRRQQCLNILRYHGAMERN